MAKREAYAGRGLRGGLYMSMQVLACILWWLSSYWAFSLRCGRLVTDLGLNLNPVPLVEAGLLTSLDSYMRSRTFWGVWSVDKEYGALLGRPGTLCDISITCPRPIYWLPDDFVSLYCQHVVALSE